MSYTDDFYKDGTLITAQTYKESVRRINYGLDRLKEYFDELESVRYKDTFQVTSPTQSVFRLTQGNYIVGSNSVKVYNNGSPVDFEETDESTVTLKTEALGGDMNGNIKLLGSSTYSLGTGMPSINPGILKYDSISCSNANPNMFYVYMSDGNYGNGTLILMDRTCKTVTS